MVKLFDKNEFLLKLGKLLASKILMCQEKWQENVFILMFTEKGDFPKCENHRVSKLMSHTLKIFERVIHSRLRQREKLGSSSWNL